MTKMLLLVVLVFSPFCPRTYIFRCSILKMFILSKEKTPAEVIINSRKRKQRIGNQGLLL